MGSLVTALASWLDARANEGVWLVRIEDIDQERCLANLSTLILNQLLSCGLRSDQEVVFQSQREPLYEAYVQTLMQKDLLYPCWCSRSDIANAVNASSHSINPASLIYPGTCRLKVEKPKKMGDVSALTRDQSLKKTPALRIKTVDQEVTWHDRRSGASHQNISSEVGDFVIKRSDGPYSYQLCVVVDDIEQSITHVVRGEDLADNTPRQQYLFEHFHREPPIYLHVPLVKNEQGEKLSKQTSAPALDLSSPKSILSTMKSAARFLGLQCPTDYNGTLQDHLMDWTDQWSKKYPFKPPKS
jgi:glutamyl-Q tRNA(Asp) synthetase